MFDVMIK